MIFIDNQKPSTLFWTWGAYVFLPINIVIGTMLFSNGASIEEVLLSSVIALIIMMILAYLAIRLSSAYRMNYSECIRYFIKNKSLSRILIIIIPVLNIGWYAIQTVMFVELLQVYLKTNTLMFIVLIIGMSYFFAIGVTAYDYLWLKNVGAIAMFILLFMVAFNIKITNNTIFGIVRPIKIFAYTIQILGTWIFSSVTCVMDVTAHVYDGKKGFKYIAISTFLINIILTLLGYTMNFGMEKFVSLNILNLIAILVSIWTTNDSNFYSTMCSLKNIGISKKKVLIFVPMISSMISIFVIKDFESFITKWLSIMSWIGIPFGVMWWIIFLKRRKAV